MMLTPYTDENEIFNTVDTPFLHVNKNVFLNNIDRLNTYLCDFNVSFRPHFKTIRSFSALDYLLVDKHSPITVSTVKEAEAIVSRGYTNVLYAVGIVESKLNRIKDLNALGANVIVLLDSVDQARSINNFCEENDCSISALVEIDCDGNRGGLKPNDPLLIQVAKTLDSGQGRFLGVLAHAGGSYSCLDKLSLQKAAQNEVNQVRLAVSNLSKRDISCRVVSIGSTPTAHSYQNLDGITEVRAGVYTFFDLVMAGIGVCEKTDIASSVVTTVIGQNKDKGWLFIDAGWMALSSDRGTAKQPQDCGYGLVANTDGQIINGLQVIKANQEHGIIGSALPSTINFDDFPIGLKIHILPNHACATSAMHRRYHVFDKVNQTYENWVRIQGW
jgi:D-serine deaminase-like pyridoxal phosphate-dependent protein